MWQAPTDGRPQTVFGGMVPKESEVNVIPQPLLNDLVRGVLSGDPSQQLAATQQFRRILSIGRYSALLLLMTV